MDSKLSAKELFQKLRHVGEEDMLQIIEEHMSNFYRQAYVELHPLPGMATDEERLKRLKDEEDFAKTQVGICH